MKLQELGGQFAFQYSQNESFAHRLQDGFRTFHYFIERGILYKKDSSDSKFLMKQAIKMASTHLERANYMVMRERSWDIFYDPEVDVSQLFL